MSASRLLSVLRARGVTVTAADGKLRHAGPKGAVTPDLLADLKANKDDVLALLTWDQPAAEARAAEGHAVLDGARTEAGRLAPTLEARRAALNVLADARSLVDDALARRDGPDLAECVEHARDVAARVVNHLSSRRPA